MQTLHIHGCKKVVEELLTKNIAMPGVRPCCPPLPLSRLLGFFSSFSLPHLLLMVYNGFVHKI